MAAMPLLVASRTGIAGIIGFLVLAAALVAYRQLILKPRLERFERQFRKDQRDAHPKDMTDEPEDEERPGP